MSQDLGIQGVLSGTPSRTRPTCVSVITHRSGGFNPEADATRLSLGQFGTMRSRVRTIAAPLFISLTHGDCVNIYRGRILSWQLTPNVSYIVIHQLRLPRAPVSFLFDGITYDQRSPISCGAGIIFTPHHHTWPSIPVHPSSTPITHTTAIPTHCNQPVQSSPLSQTSLPAAGRRRIAA